MQLVLGLGISLLVCSLFAVASRRLHFSGVLGLILAGVILGQPLVSQAIFGANLELVNFLGELGFICIMFLAGLEVSWSMLFKEKSAAAVTAVLAAVVPLLAGFAIFLFLGFPYQTALIVGICMSITAEATNARLLIELHKLKTKLGSLMMGAGIVDDILGLVMLLAVVYLSTGVFEFEHFRLVLLAITAFFAGVAAHKIFDRAHVAISWLEKIMLWLIVPFFFVAMGLQFSFESLYVNPFLAVLIVFIAIAGKIGGVILSKPYTKCSLKQLYLVGWGMNSRGAVELAIAFIAFRLHLLDSDLYSSIVLMAFLTTLAFPIFFQRILKKNPGIME